MRSVNRVISTSFWDDDLILDKFSAEDKYFFLYLLTNKFTSQLGIYHFPIKKVAPDMGYSVDNVYTLIDRFENSYGVIRFSQATNEIAILNYLRHSIIKGGKPVFDCLVKDYESVKDKSLVNYVINHLSNYEIKNDTVNQFIDYINNINNSINNNDNDSIVPRYVPRIVPRIVDDSEKTEKVKKTETKNRYGKYENVLLTEAEYDRLGTDYGVDKRERAIEYLDMYIPEKDYKSKSHNLAIRRWVMDAIERDSKYKNSQKGGTSLLDAIARA